MAFSVLIWNDLFWIMFYWFSAIYFGVFWVIRIIHLDEYAVPVSGIHTTVYCIPYTVNLIKCFSPNVLHSIYWLWASLIQNFCSGPFMNDGRCLKEKWLSPEILNAKIFTRVEIQIIDMTWNPSGYEKKIYWICNIWCFSSFILLPNDVFLNCLPGEKKGFLAAFYCYQGP